MRTYNIICLSLLAIILNGGVSSAQTSFLMTFTTSAYGSHRTETNYTQDSETSFLGISLDAKDFRQQQQFLNDVDRRQSESYNQVFESVTFLNSERGNAIRQTQVQSSIEYDFSDYEFTYSLDFDY